MGAVVKRAIVRSFVWWTIPTLGMISARVVEVVQHGGGYVWLVPS